MRHWLPWLVAALALSGIFWPGNITASHPAYQSALPYEQSPLPETFPVEVSPLEPPPPVELPMPFDLPPQEALPGELPTPQEIPQLEVFPQEGAVPPGSAAPSPAEVPAPSPQSLPAPVTPAAPARLRPVSPGLLIDEPVAQLQPPREEAPAPRIDQFVVNWTKFWDTVVLYASYPWLCCGILLLLGVPLTLLMLEIRGRRRPRVLPEEPVRKSPPPDAAPQP
ncbi:MAG: hypothetical protein RMK79_01470 [Anaerolineae bacterium]|nr:hypothetical protein [Anaerolineae bacterium]